MFIHHQENTIYSKCCDILHIVIFYSEHLISLSIILANRKLNCYLATNITNWKKAVLPKLQTLDINRASKDGQRCVTRTIIGRIYVREDICSRALYVRVLSGEFLLPIQSIFNYRRIALLNKNWKIVILLLRHTKTLMQWGINVTRDYLSAVLEV